MAFTGKATYSAGSDLPEIYEDVADLISIASPHETPLLDVLGDAARPARSTVHEWLEDSLVASQTTIDSVESTTLWTVADSSIFRVGDQLMIGTGGERVLVTAVDAGNSQITVSRGYGGSSTVLASDGDDLFVLGNAALEGADADSARFTNRSRRQNFTQIFSASVEVSGSELAVRQIGVRDELDFQKAQRTRELIRDLENSVINGVAPESSPQGSSTVRRTMKGIRSFITTNVFVPGSGGFPSDTHLTEDALNQALREVWEKSAGRVDVIAVNGREKRRINEFVASNRRFADRDETYRDLVSVYESDYGTCRIVLSRHVPTGTVLLLDSSRISVMPLAGRSFHYKPLASNGDAERGQVIGEYTLEFRNESAHGMIRGFTS